MSSTVPIADPDQLEVCPYDPSHRVQSRRMVYHLERCRKVFNGQKKTCPFNGKHRVPAPELNYHISTCPDKAVIDQDLRYSRMKQSGFMDDAPCGDLSVPDDDFNIASEESWESEINDDQSYFRLGRKRIDSSYQPCNNNNNTQNNEQLRLPSFTPTAIANMPVYRFSTMTLQSLGRGRGRGKVPQENVMSGTENITSNQPNNASFGRGFGKVAGIQQWQKSDTTTVSASTENTFSLGIGRGIKKKENIEHNNSSKKTPKVVVTLEELQKQSRRLEKKLRQISKLKEMQDDGTTLDKEEEMKLAKKESLEEELDQITTKIKSWKLK